MTMRCMTIWLGIGLFAISMVGCGGGGPEIPPLGQVTGVVTINGQPMEGVSVIFEPTGTRASTGVTDAEGRYELFFNPENKGAVIGDHLVRISKEMLADSEGPAVVIPDEWNTNTIQKATVKEGENTFDFAITTKTN